MQSTDATSDFIFGIKLTVNETAKIIEKYYDKIFLKEEKTEYKYDYFDYDEDDEDEDEKKKSKTIIRKFMNMTVPGSKYGTTIGQDNFFEIEIEKNVRFTYISVDSTDVKPKKLFYLSNCIFNNYISFPYGDKSYEISKKPQYKIPCINMVGIRKLKKELKLMGEIGVYSIISVHDSS